MPEQRRPLPTRPSGVSFVVANCVTRLWNQRHDDPYARELLRQIITDGQRWLVLFKGKHRA